MKQQELKNIIAAVTKRMFNLQPEGFVENCPISNIDINKWEWPQGVGLYGLLRYYQYTKDKETFDFIVNWFEERIKEGIPLPNVNTTAPLLTLAFLYEMTGKKQYLDICTERAQWLLDNLPRTEENGFLHIGTFHEPMEIAKEWVKGQLWDDTIFMAVLFLGKIGTITGNKAFIDESLRQMLLHIKYLTDKKTGLWYHGWSFVENSNLSGALWARGNCWITAGFPDYFEITGINNGAKLFMQDTLERQISALSEYQHDDGMWSTLINEQNTYKESSATAGFVYGILKAVRMGIIDKKYKNTALKGLRALLTQISDDGTVLNVSYGTGIRDLEVYRTIPIHPMAYGQALTLLALSEGLYIHEEI